MEDKKTGPTKILTCGCCDGPVEDRCICWNHQDVPRGWVVRVCTYHTPKTAEGYHDVAAAEMIRLRGGL